MEYLVFQLPGQSVLPITNCVCTCVLWIVLCWVCIHLPLCMHVRKCLCVLVSFLWLFKVINKVLWTLMLFYRSSSPATSSKAQQHQLRHLTANTTNQTTSVFYNSVHSKSYKAANFTQLFLIFLDARYCWTTAVF